MKTSKFMKEWTKPAKKRNSGLLEDVVGNLIFMGVVLLVALVFF